MNFVAVYVLPRLCKWMCLKTQVDFDKWYLIRRSKWSPICDRVPNEKCAVLLRSYLSCRFRGPVLRCLQMCGSREYGSVLRCEARIIIETSIHRRIVKFFRIMHFVACLVWFTLTCKILLPQGRLLDRSESMQIWSCRLVSNLVIFFVRKRCREMKKSLHALHARCVGLAVGMISGVWAAKWASIPSRHGHPVSAIRWIVSYRSMYYCIKDAV